MEHVEIPTRGEQDYFRAFGAVAVFVAASTNGVPCLIGRTGGDLGRMLDSIRARWHWSIGMTHAWWMADNASAKRLIDAVNARYPIDARGLFDIEADELAARIERAAINADIAVTAHAEAVRRVRIALAHVDGVIEAANRDGGLGWFNRAFREWRRAQAPNVAGAMPYARARTKLRGVVVRRLALGEAPLGNDLLSEVFPKAIAERRGARSPDDRPMRRSRRDPEKRISDL